MRSLRAFATFALFVLLAVPAMAVNKPTRMAKGTFLSKKYPFRFAGQIFFNSGGVDYIGTGTAIKTRSVLTAGHNVYDPDSGYSTDIEYRRGAYGDTTLNDKFASRIAVLASYRQAANASGGDSVRAFAQDFAGLIFNTPVAGGSFAATSTDQKYLRNPFSRLAIGYGAEFHSGDFPLQVSPASNFKPVSGAFWECGTLAFEGGMSGGPLFTRTEWGAYVVTGIVVSSSGQNGPGGIHIVDAAMAGLIKNSLK